MMTIANETKDCIDTLFQHLQKYPTALQGSRTVSFTWEKE